MTEETPITEILPPARTNESLPADQRPSKPGRVSGKLKIALDAIIFEGAEMDASAKKAGITTRAVRLAMAKPHVIGYMRTQRATLVNELSASNVHHLRTMRAESPNQMVRLGAVRTIEDIADGRGGRGSSVNVNVGVAIQAGFILDLREDDER
jgi:hypothetical protein